MSKIIGAAAILDDATRLAHPTPQFASGYLDVGEAYGVQRELVNLRIARGERIVGLKMGFTSRAKMVQMGVSDMIWGRLTDKMIVEDGGAIDLTSHIHPRAEPEIAFLLKTPLAGRVTPMQALDAVAAVAPALEIIDSRYENFSFSLPDVVADNCSSSGFVVGPWAPPSVALDNLGMILSVDGRPVHFASSAALLGHPLRSLAAAARLAGHQDPTGEMLGVGSIVLAGASTAAVALHAGGKISVEVERLGRADFNVEGE